MGRRNNPSQEGGVSFRANMKADVVYEISVEDARIISFTETTTEFSAGKTGAAGLAGVGAGILYAMIALAAVFTG